MAMAALLLYKTCYQTGHDVVVSHPQPPEPNETYTIVYNQTYLVQHSVNSHQQKVLIQ